jgi:hypothetical protein
MMLGQMLLERVRKEVEGCTYDQNDRTLFVMMKNLQKAVARKRTASEKYLRLKKGAKKAADNQDPGSPPGRGQGATIESLAWGSRPAKCISFFLGLIVAFLDKSRPPGMVRRPSKEAHVTRPAPSSSELGPDYEVDDEGSVINIPKPFGSLGKHNKYE